MDKSVEDALLEVLRKHPDGCNQDVIDREASGIPLQARADALNKLLTHSRIQLFNSNNSLVYKLVSQEDSIRFKNLSAEELMVYQTIKNSGNTGLWTKDMKMRTNLPQPHITKILKTLENRKLVKSVKSVSNPGRKVFMLFELEPSRELTGGAWYTENQFDSEFIEVLREAAYRFIQQKGEVTIPEVASFIRAKGFSKVDLREEDISLIVQTLVYDGRIDQIDGQGTDDVHDLYRPAIHSIPPTSAYTSTPCGLCPVSSECHEGGVISPQTCVYYDAWLAAEHF